MATAPKRTHVNALASLMAALGELPMDWIHDALATTDTASQRHRRLPAEACLLLIVAMGLMRDRAITDVADDLHLGLSGPKQPALQSNVISKARARLGAAPVEHVADRTAQWAHADADTRRWRGLALYGLDGSSLRVPDTDENREYFGGHYSGKKRGTSGYPLARIVALVALRSHLIAGLSVGPFVGTSEQSLTPTLLALVPDQSLAILDRAFLSTLLLLHYARGGRDRHWLLRMKSNTRYRTVKRLGRHDELAVKTVSEEARRRDPSLPESFPVRVIRYQRRGFRAQKLITSLLDPKRWPAHELVALYHERWECELAFDEIKTEQLDREEALRSKLPWGVRQEIFGLMIGYNLVRRRMARSADAHRVVPLRMSFVVMMRSFRDRWTVLAVAGLSCLARVDRQARRQARRAILPPRRPIRQYPRAVKLKMSNYPRKRPVVSR